MEHDQIEELLELTRENNRLLRSLHKAQMWATIFRVVYWTVILGGMAGAYYFLQPIFEQYMGTFKAMMNSADEMGKAGKGGITNIKGLFEAVGI